MFYISHYRLRQHQHASWTRRGRRRRARLAQKQRDLAHSVATIEARNDLAASPDRELAFGDNQELLRRISDLPERLTLSISTRQTARRQPRELVFAEVGEEWYLSEDGDDVVRVISHA